MKKTSIFLLIVIMILQSMMVSAEIVPEIEKIPDKDYQYDGVKNGRCKVASVNGDKYVFSMLQNSVPYSEAAYNFFEGREMEYFWTGSVYIARKNTMDDAPRKYWNMTRGKVEFYDENLNLLSETEFEGYVYDVGYYNGEFYCDVAGYVDENNTSVLVKQPRTMKTSDMMNWVETDNPCLRANGTVYWHRKSVAIDNCVYDVQYENKLDDIEYEDVEYGVSRLGITGTVGRWIYKIDRLGNVYLSNDNIYFTKIISNVNNISNIIYYTEENGYLLLDVSVQSDYIVRFKFPLQQLNDEMNKSKNPMYVKLNDKLLGFETPPVIEEGRTLVPMRFLFEKMGADVGWYDESKMVVAQKNNMTVEVSIDSKIATVNGKTVELDVPPRLINGKTMIPLRFLSENLGYNVSWDDRTRIATIIAA